VIYINRVVLLDSLAFLNAPLDGLPANRRASRHTWPLLQQWRKLSDVDDEEVREERLRVATRKGVFPYDHVTGGARQLRREKNLPPAGRAWFNVLTQRETSAEEIEFAKRVWSAFACRSMKDYSRVYMEVDVFLLAEAIVSMREKLFLEFGLDMVQHLSMPMMTKDLMLKTSGEELELISDVDMALMIKRSIRGGVAFIGERLVELKRSADLVPLASGVRGDKSVHGYLTSDAKGRPRSLLYLDFNNL